MTEEKTLLEAWDNILHPFRQTNPPQRLPMQDGSKLVDLAQPL